MWNSIVSVSDRCLFIYFSTLLGVVVEGVWVGLKHKHAVV